ncbi:M48 family metallopeptidase [Haladaptatus sp. NG-SE-30]
MRRTVVSAIPLAVTAHAGLALASYAIVRTVAARLSRRDEPPERTATQLRTLRHLGYLFGGLAAVLVSHEMGVTEGVAGTLTAVVPGIAGTGYQTVVVASLVGVGPVLVVGLAVRLATVPYWRQVRPWDVTHGGAIRWFLAHLPVVPLVVAGGTMLVWAAPAGWGRVLATLVVVLAGSAVLPFLLGYVLRSRSPSQRERELLEPIPPDVSVRVVPDETRIGVAFAAGILPGARRIFLAESLFDVLERDELEAVVAHELAHHRRKHVLLRVVLPICLLLPWIAAIEFGVPHALAGGTLFALPCSLLLFRAIRWTEYDADEWVADHAAGDELVRALERLVTLRFVVTGVGRYVTLFAAHPSIEKRIERLSPATRTPSRGRR